MTAYAQLQTALRARPRTWLVTGAAGFIGSNLVEALLRLDQTVVGLDNFSTGHRRNLEEACAVVTPAQRARFRFREGDIQDPAIAQEVCRGVELVLHQAALCSVPASLENPLRHHHFNVTGFLCLLIAARDQGVRRVVYASSSSVYGDDPVLPKREDRIGRPLSPYAAQKYMDEVYAGVFGRCYGLSTVGLRYFNVFGPRQDPHGAYAAVIPRWIAALVRGQPVYIHGDGETTRDFCYVANVVQANLLAATTEHPEAQRAVFNVGAHRQTSLNQLFELLRERLGRAHPAVRQARPVYDDFRPGDVRHSLADIAAARRVLGYEPEYTVADGLDLALEWYLQHLALDHQ